MHKLSRYWGIIAVAFLLLVGAVACGPNSATKVAKHDVATRTSIYERASDAYPIPKVSNFPLRQALIKMTKREDELNHPWYIYLVSDYGSVYQYYVSSTPPINKCDFLSSTENVVYDQHGNVVTTAPSVDGIFYGGAGGAGSCTAMVFFDATTDAEMSYDVHAIVSDVPLSIYKNVPFGGPTSPPPTASPEASATTTS